MGSWSKGDIQQLLEDEKQFDSQIITDLTSTQIKEARYKIWYKLFKLLNYNVTMDMFTGSPMRWRTIKLYASIIRGIYNGRIDEYTSDKSNSVYSSGLIKYIQGLMVSGEEPFDVPQEYKGSTNTISIQTLLNNDNINYNDVTFIYSNVSGMDNTPDTSISGCRNVTRHVINNLTNPIERQKAMNLVLFDENLGTVFPLTKKQTQPQKKQNLFGTLFSLIKR